MNVNNELVRKWSWNFKISQNLNENYEATEEAQSEQPVFRSRPEPQTFS
jgi:hypothetical protein